MKAPSSMQMPWDMVVFLSITAIGFGFSMQKLKTFELKERVARTPQAVEGSLQPEMANDASGILDLGCVEQKLNREKVTSHQGEIRLKGRFCSLSTVAMRNFGGVRVRNLTTGKEGTIFLRGLESVFVTDVVDLSPGRNEIQVEWRNAPEASPRELIAEIYEK